MRTQRTTTAQSIPRQPTGPANSPPTSGATTGATPPTVSISVNALAAARPATRSAITARPITIPPAPVKPWISRAITSTARLGVRAVATPASTQTAALTINGPRRPSRSESGPVTSCPNARPTRNVVKVSCTPLASVSRATAIAGNPGRYRSVANGASAASRASVSSSGGRMPTSAGAGPVWVGCGRRSLTARVNHRCVRSRTWKFAMTPIRTRDAGALPTTRAATSSGLGLVFEKLDPVIGHLNRDELHALVGRIVGPVEDESRRALRISEYHPVAAVARPERLLPLDPRTGHLPTRRGRHPHRVALLAKARPQHVDGPVFGADQPRTIGEQLILGQVQLLGRLDSLGEPQRLAPRRGGRSEQQDRLSRC